MKQNLGVFQERHRETIQAIIRQTRAPITIDDAPVDAHGNPVLYCIRVWGHGEPKDYYAFWLEVDRLGVG